VPAITKTVVSTAKAASKDQFIWDDEVHGFGLKVTPAGAKSYVFTYRLGAQKPRIKIGDHGAWTPQAARDEAKRLRRLVDQGIDPRQEKRQRAEDRVNLEVTSYVERFIDQYLSRRWDGGFKDAAALLRNRIAARWSGRTLKEITRADVAHLLHSVEGDGARRMTFALIRKMFKWAVSNGDIAESPARDMEPPPTLPSRDRVLSDEELALCWHAAGKLPYPFGPFIRMLALTGQRRDEVAGMRWEELDRSRRMWTIPGARVKNATTNDVPLSGAALAVLDEMANLASKPDDDEPVRWPRRGFVFTTTGKSAISGFSKTKLRLDALMLDRAKQIAEEAGENPETVTLEAWRLHDLRRTLATGLRVLGVSLDATEAVLNHKSGSRSGIVQVYQRHEYKEEKRTALDQWAENLLGAAGKADDEKPQPRAANDADLVHAA
jgi:integrase